MSRIYELASVYMDRFAALNPTSATILGVTGHDTEMTDYSPAGAEARAALDRDTLAALRTAPVAGERDRIAHAVMLERLQLRLDLFAAGEYFRELRVLFSPLQFIRMCFDQMPRDSEAAWERIATRMALVPQALDGLRATLREGLRRGLPAARRQAVACATQAAVWSGQGGHATPFFHTLVAAYDRAGIGSAALQTRLAHAAQHATDAYAAMGRFLREEYAPHASERDAVGVDRYALHARMANGIALDLPETYA